MPKMLEHAKNGPEAEESRRNFALETIIHKIMDIICLSSNVCQCHNIAGSVVPVQAYFQIFLICYYIVICIG